MLLSSTPLLKCLKSRCSTRLALRLFVPPRFALLCARSLLARSSSSARWLAAVAALPSPCRLKVSFPRSVRLLRCIAGVSECIWARHVIFHPAGVAILWRQFGKPYFAAGCLPLLLCREAGPRGPARPRQVHEHAQDHQARAPIRHRHHGSVGRSGLQHASRHPGCEPNVHRVPVCSTQPFSLDQVCKFVPGPPAEEAAPAAAPAKAEKKPAAKAEKAHH